MKRNSILSLAASLLVTATVLTGCGTSLLLTEDMPSAPAQTNGTTGKIPALTTPSYYVPGTPTVDDTYTPEYQLQLLADRDFGGGIFRFFNRG